MKFQPEFEQGKILKRYKRFLSDIELESESITAHTPNTGSMKKCWNPGWKVAVSKSDNPKRKLPYTLELTHNGDSWIQVNTFRTNSLVKEALEKDVIEELSGFSHLKAEAKVGKSRLDFLLAYPDDSQCYVEVKNVTYINEDRAEFPDSVSERGKKHLLELLDLHRQGFRAVMLYVVSREDAKSFAPCAELDPEYARTLKEVHAKGVEVLAYQCKVSPKEVAITHPIPFEI